MLQFDQVDAPVELTYLRNRLRGMRDACDEMQVRITRLLDEAADDAESLEVELSHLIDNWNYADIRSHCEHSPADTPPVDAEVVIHDAQDKLNDIYEGLEAEISEYEREQEEEYEEEQEEEEEVFEWVPLDPATMTDDHLQGQINLTSNNGCRCRMCTDAFEKLPAMKAELAERQARARLGL